VEKDAAQEVGSKASWSCDKPTASSHFRVSSYWRLVPERILAEPWKVPSQTAGEQFVTTFLNLCLLINSFHLVVKLSAAPELISKDDVSVMLFDRVPLTNFNFVPIISLAGEYFTHLGLTSIFHTLHSGIFAYS